MALSKQQEFNLYNLCLSLFPLGQVQSLEMCHLKRLLPYVQFDNPEFRSLDVVKMDLSEIKKTPKAIDAIIDEFCNLYPINMWTARRQLEEPLKDPTIADLLEQHGSGCNIITQSAYWLTTDDMSAICAQFNTAIKNIPDLHIIEPQASSSSTRSDAVVLKVDGGKDQEVSSIKQQAQDHFTHYPQCTTVLAPFLTGGLGGRSIAGSSASHWNLDIYTKDHCGNLQCKTVDVPGDGFCGDWVLQEIATRIPAEVSSQLTTGYTSTKNNVELRQHTIARLRDHSPHQSMLASREYISQMAQSLDIQKSLDSSNARSSDVVKSGPTLFKSQPQSPTVGVQTKPEDLEKFKSELITSLSKKPRFETPIGIKDGVSFNYQYSESTPENSSDTSSTHSDVTDGESDSGSDVSSVTSETKTKIVGIIAKPTSQGETFSVAPSSQSQLTRPDQQMACLMQMVLEKHCLLEGKEALELAIPEQFIDTPVNSDWVLEQIQSLNSRGGGEKLSDTLTITVNDTVMVTNGVVKAPALTAAP